jgi:hypothetical protein
MPFLFLTRRRLQNLLKVVLVPSSRNVKGEDFVASPSLDGTRKRMPWEIFHALIFLQNVKLLFIP